MKKKFVSMLLVLTLVMTGIPSGGMIETVNAAELSEENVTFSGEEEVELLHSEAGDSYTLSISENGKAVGSDGVVYDDVVYLSAENVRALSIDAQKAYVTFCDDIASARKDGEDLENVIVAVNEDGRLVFHYSIPVKALETSMDELAEGVWETTEEMAEERTAEEEIATDDSTQITTASDEAVSEEIQETESIAEEVQETSSQETSLIEDTESIAEEIQETESAAEEVRETSSQEISSIEGTESITEETQEASLTEEIESTAESETESEEYVLTAENMELIPKLEEMHFPVVEDVKADLIVDLGYGDSEIQQFNSLLPKNDWFSGQLTKDQRKIYNACKVMGNGTNQFKFNYANILNKDRSDLCQAISAYIMTEPYKCDWMDLSETARLDIQAWGYTENDPTYDYVVTIPKSEFYNEKLVKDANAIVLQLAAQAQNYAVEKYPTSPVYGIVEYFDQWICENNYYNDLGVTGGASLDSRIREIYYYCHSSYGILLKGSGVCESYALAMTRLLDTIGIPNMYATGAVPGGGHAWNYIQMPDGNWYLHDSTWNDDEKSGISTKNYLLCADDGYHFPMGNRYAVYSDIFNFVIPASSRYRREGEVVLSETELHLLPKQTKELVCQNAYTNDANVPKVWMSSDEKVAKVDQNGKITAVAPGTAEVKYIVAGISAVCTVNVHQINSLTFVDGGKNNLATSCGAKNGKWAKQEIELLVSHKDEDGAYTAEKLVKDKIFAEPEVTSSKSDVAMAETVFDGDILKLVVTPKAKGSTKITVAFEGKKATLNFSVMGEQLDKDMFDLKEVEELAGKKNPYTGKAYKPKVVLSDEGKEKKVKFKVNYSNNTNAGTASVIIVGAGDYGGQIVKTFKIEKMPLSVVDSEKIKIKDSVYNGGVNQMKGTIKNLNQYTDDKGKNVSKKVSLKAGKDYDILYINKTTREKTTQPTKVGTYTMEIVGKGSYAGTYSIQGEYNITPIDIKKVKVSVKVNGTTPTVTVAIGKNPLPKTDYKMTYYTDKDCTDEISGSVFLPKTQYYVKIEPAGANIVTGTKSKPIIKSFKTK